MGPIGLTEIIVIAAVVLLLFGARIIPSVTKNIAKTPAAFSKGLREKSKDGSN